MSQPLQQAEFEAAQLMKEHPPVWRAECKQWVAEITCPPGANHQGRLHYSRWAPRVLPVRIAWPGPRDLIVARPDFYDYQPVGDFPSATEWHVNFADPDLFVAYGSHLLAQDEMQVAEHPVLGALHEALDPQGPATLTKDEIGPTPILITGAERRCRIATEPNAAAGRPQGLYGNRFSMAPRETIEKAVTRIDSPTISNFIAIAAPYGGTGFYHEAPIRYSLVAAFTGFQAAVEIGKAANPAAETVVHTGFWGCGAFGGNRILMTMIQALAASAAGVSRVIFHTGDVAGLETIEQARERLADIFLTPTISPRELIQHLVDWRYPWGVSDGN